MEMIPNCEQTATDKWGWLWQVLALCVGDAHMIHSQVNTSSVAFPTFGVANGGSSLFKQCHTQTLEWLALQPGASEDTLLD